MSSSEIPRTLHNFAPEQIDILAIHVRLVLSMAEEKEHISGEAVDAARSALRRIVEQAKECAAPALLEAAKRVLNAEGYSSGTIQPRDYLRMTLAELHAAVNKAESNS